MNEISEHKKVLAFIRTVRNSFDGASEVYTRGSCFQFYLILKSAFPKAQPYYNFDHVITLIGSVYYDINGVAKKTNHQHWNKCKIDSKVNNIVYSIFIRDSKLKSSYKKAKK